MGITPSGNEPSVTSIDPSERPGSGGNVSGITGVAGGGFLSAIRPSEELLAELFFERTERPVRVGEARPFIDPNIDPNMRVFAYEGFPPAPDLDRDMPEFIDPQARPDNPFPTPPISANDLLERTRGENERLSVDITFRDSDTGGSQEIIILPTGQAVPVNAINALARTVRSGGTPSPNQLTIIEAMTPAQRRAAGIFLTRTGEVRSFRDVLTRAVQNAAAGEPLTTNQQAALGTVFLNTPSRGGSVHRDLVTQLAGSARGEVRANISAAVQQSMRATRDIRRTARADTERQQRGTPARIAENAIGRLEDGRGLTARQRDLFDSFTRQQQTALLDQGLAPRGRPNVVTNIVKRAVRGQRPTAGQHRYLASLPPQQRDLIQATITRATAPGARGRDSLRRAGIANPERALARLERAGVERPGRALLTAARSGERRPVQAAIEADTQRERQQAKVEALQTRQQASRQALRQRQRAQRAAATSEAAVALAERQAQQRRQQAARLAQQRRQLRRRQRLARQIQAVPQDSERRKELRRRRRDVVERQRAAREALRQRRAARRAARAEQQTTRTARQAQTVQQARRQQRAAQPTPRPTSAGRRAQQARQRVSAARRAAAAPRNTGPLRNLSAAEQQRVLLTRAVARRQAGIKLTPNQLRALKASTARERRAVR